MVFSYPGFQAWSRRLRGSTSTVRWWRTSHSTICCRRPNSTGSAPRCRRSSCTCVRSATRSTRSSGCCGWWRRSHETSAPSCSRCSPRGGWCTSHSTSSRRWAPPALHNVAGYCTAPHDTAPHCTAPWAKSWDLSYVTEYTVLLCLCWGETSPGFIWWLTNMYKYNNYTSGHLGTQSSQWDIFRWDSWLSVSVGHVVGCVVTGDTVGRACQVMLACFDVFTMWDDEYDRLQGQLRDIVKKMRSEHIKMVWRVNPAHKRLQGRLDQIRKYVAPTQHTTHGL